MKKLLVVGLLLLAGTFVGAAPEDRETSRTKEREEIRIREDARTEIRDAKVRKREAREKRTEEIKQANIQKKKEKPSRLELRITKLERRVDALEAAVLPLVSFRRLTGIQSTIEDINSRPEAEHFQEIEE